MVWQNHENFRSVGLVDVAFEQIEIPAKLLDNFLYSNTSNINHSLLHKKQSSGFAGSSICSKVLASTDAPNDVNQRKVTDTFWRHENHWH